jgi:hypothetical protein
MKTFIWLIFDNTIVRFVNWCFHKYTGASLAGGAAFDLDQECTICTACDKPQADAFVSYTGYCSCVDHLNAVREHNKKS